VSWPLHARIPRGRVANQFVMHIFWLVVFGLSAFFWVFHGLRVAYGALRLPWLKDFAPASDADCPRISVLFAARDEEEKLL
jgi:hypothetical protein